MDSSLPLPVHHKQLFNIGTPWRPAPCPMPGAGELKKSARCFFAISAIMDDIDAMDGTADDATAEPLHNMALSTEALSELVRQRFLAFLQGYTLHDEEESRSHPPQAGAQTPGTQPHNPYVEQVRSVTGGSAAS